MSETLFTKIVKREIPADIVYETDNVLAFRDISPQAPVHVLIIPKEEIESVREMNGAEHGKLLGEMIDAANEIAKNEGIYEEGFRLVFNSGAKAGQTVFHLHMHLLGGREMKWPPG